MQEINKAHKITSKSQAFGPQISHKTIHGKMILGFKKSSITKLGLKRYK